MIAATDASVRIGSLRGREAYEASVRVCPRYDDGSERKAWEALGEVEKWSWERERHADNGDNLNEQWLLPKQDGE